VSWPFHNSSKIPLLMSLFPCSGFLGWTRFASRDSLWQNEGLARTASCTWHFSEAPCEWQPVKSGGDLIAYFFFFRAWTWPCLSSGACSILVAFSHVLLFSKQVSDAITDLCHHSSMHRSIQLSSCECPPGLPDLPMGRQPNLLHPPPTPYTPLSSIFSNLLYSAHSQQGADLITTMISTKQMRVCRNRFCKEVKDIQLKGGILPKKPICGPSGHI
jgi:hypothetical protein